MRDDTFEGGRKTESVEALGINATLNTHLKGGRLCLKNRLLIQATYSKTHKRILNEQLERTT